MLAELRSLKVIKCIINMVQKRWMEINIEEKGVENCLAFPKAEISVTDRSVEDLDSELHLLWGMNLNLF